MGVYKVDVNTCKLEHYIVANYQSYNEMNGNNINDVFVDEEKRIWLANYPTGITIMDNRYENYHWMKHSMGNHQSLINDQYMRLLKTRMAIYGLEPVMVLVFISQKLVNGTRS